MKKISSLIVCFALLAAGTAFALDLPDALKIPGLTVTGDAHTGLRVAGSTIDDYGKLYSGVNPTETGAQDPAVYAYSDAIGDGTPFRAQLQLVWERDNLGVKTRFRYRPDNGPVTSTLTPIYEKDKDGKLVTDPVSGDPIPTGEYSGTPATPDGRLGGTLNNLNNTVNKAFVYGYLWDKKIKVSAGKGLDGAWGLFYSSFSGNNNGDFDGKDGVKVEVKPIDGLNIGAFYGTGNLFGKAYKSGNDSGFTDQLETDRRLVVGAKYSSGLFGVIVSTYHNFVEADYAAFLKDDPVDHVDAALPNTSNLLFGAYVQPIEPLRIDISVLAVNLGSKTEKEQNDGNDTTGYKKGDYNKNFVVFPKLKVGYALNEQLSFGLAFTDIKISDAYYSAVADAENAEDRGLGLLFPITINPSVGYALSDDLSLSLDLNFKINVGSSDQFGFGVKPAAEFSLGSGATFVVYDELTFYSKANDDADFRLKHPNFAGELGGASGTTNTLQFDFVWAF